MDPERPSLVEQISQEPACGELCEVHRQKGNFRVKTIAVMINWIHLPSLRCSCMGQNGRATANLDENCIGGDVGAGGP